MHRPLLATALRGAGGGGARLHAAGLGCAASRPAAVPGALVRTTDDLADDFRMGRAACLSTLMSHFLRALLESTKEQSTHEQA